MFAATESVGAMPDSVRGSLSRRDRILVALFVGIQIVIPAGLLGFRWVTQGSQPTFSFPFSWQMYSAEFRGKSVEYVGIDGAGKEVQLSTDELTPVLRAVAYDYSVPEMLCDANPGLVAVQRRTGVPALQDFTEVVAC